jgi:hypothetical protein
MRPKDLERVLPITANHLAQLRHKGEGPRYVRHGHLIIYRAGDVSEWLLGGIVDPSPPRVPELRRRSAAKRPKATASKTGARRSRGVA